MRGGGTSGGHFGATDETTERLVGRCERVPWLGIDGETDNAGTKGRLLGVEMAGAMTSALSVVEVTAQREKPGVQTPSRKMDIRTERTRGGEEGIELRSDDGMTVRPMGQEKSPFEVEGEA